MEIKTPTLREMLAAGVHFGHKRARWNPKMAPYIFASKNGVSIINLEKTKELLESAIAAVCEEVKAGKNVVFVTSKRQARQVVRDAAESCDMPFVTEKWRGGTLTNFDIVSKSFKTLKNLDEQIASPEFSKLSKLEQNKIKEKATKIDRIFGGISELKKKPDILFLIGVADEENALKEAKNLGVKTIALCDSNANPQEIDWPIPANDDATKSIKLLVECVAENIKNTNGQRTKLTANSELNHLEK
ncbi:MAG: 30S ribosomal protein S2 [Candidatus Berkelbacteria bacterium]|nr:30S ribosomal protein S2 [Candidatus Berkelbacteria bacterium]